MKKALKLQLLALHYHVMNLLSGMGSAVYNMAEALDVQETVYAGEAASFFLLRPVVEMDSYEKGCISLIDGIKKQHTIDRMEVSNFIQDPAATPTSQGSIVVDYKQLVPKRFDLYMEFNPHDFETSFFAPELQKLLLDRSLPPTASNFLLLQLLRRINQYYEYSLWQQRLAYNPTTGSQTVPATLVAATLNNNFYYFDGLIKKALDDANTIQVPSPVALTYLNIRAMFEVAIELVPPALLAKYGKMGLRYLVSNTDWLKYNRALREDTFKNQDTTEASQDKWNGYDVVRCAGIPENTFFVCIANPNPQSGNLFIGTNEFDDKSNLKMSQLQANSDLWFVRAEQKVDTQIGFTDQLVIYTTLTA